MCFSLLTDIISVPSYVGQLKALQRGLFRSKFELWKSYYKSFYHGC